MYLRMMIAYCVILAAGIYLYYFFKRTAVFWGLDGRKKWVKGILFLAAVVCVALAVNVWSLPIVFELYFLMLALLMDLLHLAFGRRLRGGRWQKMYRCGLVPAVLTLLIVAAGFWNMTHVKETVYTIQTHKQVKNYRIALLSDIHFGTTMDAQKLQAYCDEISAKKVDLVILDGDITDENTTLEGIEECFQALGSIDSTYGIFYIFGNHDKSRYRPNPHYTVAQLTDAISANEITILTDEIYNINDDLTLIARDDAAMALNGGKRKNVQQLLAGVDKSRFLLLLDHQPLELEENSRLGIDLQLSGHTHSGQIWPIGIFNELSGMNYGHDQMGDFQVIVTSGMGGWGYPVRTQGRSEYVIVELSGS